MDKNEFEKAMDAVVKKFEGMSVEEFERDVLCLNGVMTEDLFEKVLAESRKMGYVESEDVAYNIGNKYSLSASEFMDVFHYLDEVTREHQKQDEECTFPRTMAYFLYKGELYLWDLMIGQGSSCSITHIKDRIEVEPMKIDSVDSTIRFYKRLK